MGINWEPHNCKCDHLLPSTLLLVNSCIHADLCCSATTIMNEEIVILWKKSLVFMWLCMHSGFHCCEQILTSVILAFDTIHEQLEALSWQAFQWLRVGLLMRTQYAVLIITALHTCIKIRCTQNLCTQMLSDIIVRIKKVLHKIQALWYMWQSRVEIEHYSVAYFDRVTANAFAQYFR